MTPAPTAVRVPVRVRLTGVGPGLPSTPGRVHDAVVRAVQVALPHAPWHDLGVAGPADVVLAPVTAAVAEGTDESVVTRRVLDAAREGARRGAELSLLDLLGSDEAVLERPSGAPSEPFDPARRRSRGGRTTYVVPFFDGGSTEVPLVEMGEPEVESWTPPPATPPLPASGAVVSLQDALDIAWAWHVHRHGPRWAPLQLGHPGYYGRVRIGGRPAYALVWVRDVTGPIAEDGTVAGPDVSYLYQPVQLYLPAAEESGEVRRARLEPSSGYELVSTGQPATVDSVEAAFRAVATRLAPDDPLHDQVRRRALATTLLTGGREEPAEGQVLWELRGGGQTAVAVLPAALEGEAVEGPIAFVTGGAGGGTGGERSGREGAGERGAGSGRGQGEGADDAAAGRDGASGGRAGGRAGSRGDAEHSGGTSPPRVWPSTRTSLEAQICAPYLVEPHLDELQADHGLPRQMRRLAAELGMSECGYLGAFALNAARAVAVRARGVGLASAAASSTNDVAVRSDGSGNNGFLEVRPGASPEFEWLRVLARIGAEVSRFVQDVVSCYLDPANRHLVRVDEDWDPNAEGWALRFSGDARTAEQHGFMHLYAETCRVLLLQQLRTSAHGIAARQQHLDETVTAFSAALGTIGRLVVELSTLRRALAHSRDTLATGTVRQVLSTPRVVGHGPERFVLPAPIGSVPADVLEAVGDARVERRGGQRVVVHAGRSWTTSELDEGIGMRRSVLNQVDPLFLQVPDLDSLYARSRRDEQSVHRYLADLLDEMAEANAGMTEEASDDDDGSFFALEASKHVEREGGRDWRGLRYELHGIHALADDQLAPCLRDNRDYTEGVNLAIGRKAGFDAFVALFSTIGIIALGLLCAPLGVVAVVAVTGAAGLAMTYVDVQEAERQSDLYRSVFNPEMFLSQQDVEMARLMATLSIAFSVFDVVGVGRGAKAIVRGASAQLRVGRRSLNRAAAQAATDQAGVQSGRVLRGMTQEVMENAARQAAKEGAIALALDALLPVVIAPVLVPWLRAQARERGTLHEVDAALGDLAVQHALQELSERSTPSRTGVAPAPAGSRP